MPIPQAVQDIIRLANTQRIEEDKLESLKSRKNDLQSELSLINDQITAQQPIVIAARAAIKAAASFI